MLKIIKFMLGVLFVMSSHALDTEKYLDFVSDLESIDLQESGSVITKIRKIIYKNKISALLKIEKYDDLTWGENSIVVKELAVLGGDRYGALVFAQARGKSGFDIEGVWASAFIIVNIVNGKIELIKKFPFDQKEPQGKGYGCIFNQKVLSLDLNLDGSPELVILTGGGEDFRHAIKDEMTINIFDGTTGETLIQEEIMYSNINTWRKPDPTLGYFMYQFNSGESDLPAENRFSKLFFNDFDKNGKLDLIVWRKIFISRKVSEGMGDNHGFKNGIDSFIRYEESLTEKKWDKVGITNVMAIKLLEKYNLSWDVGYPNKSYCDWNKGGKIKINLNHR